MNIKIVLLSDLSSEQSLTYIKQIAKWHYASWGKYVPNISELEWAEKLKASLADPDIQRIVAIDEQKNLLGSISLKKTHNIQEIFPEYSPWASAMYVAENVRGKGIARKLLNAVCNLAAKQSYSKIYGYTHHLELEGFYEKLGWNQILPATKIPYTYRDAPILLLSKDV